MIKAKTKFLIASLLSFSIIASTLSACSFQKQADGNSDSSISGPISPDASLSSGANAQPPDGDSENNSTPDGASDTSAQYFSDKKPSIITAGFNADADAGNVVPCVEAYKVNPDLSNISNLDRFYLEDDVKQHLAQDGFVVRGSGWREFFEVYEMNRYAYIPNFITVDSLMHTYHLYFSYLLKNIERNYLSDYLGQLSQQMLGESISQYEQLKGSKWESAAERNVAFFAVGAKLLDDGTEVPDSVKDPVAAELDHINQADAILRSEIVQGEEDYTQYIPRGYYEGDARLERYFKAMMWYGRIHFPQDNEDMNRSALLMTTALLGNAKAHQLWDSIYAATSFFAGASDDNSVYEYAAAIRETSGKELTLQLLMEDDQVFQQFQDEIGSLPAPQINSIPIEEGDDNTIPGFRFMGQRFTIDAAIMQNLIYQRVGENSSGSRRMLPDVLDVPAALGSDTALGILNEEGAADYPDYSRNMELLRGALSEENDALWSASLYSMWLNTLRPLLSVKGEGYPMFMQSENWLKKDLECFAGSLTELKHDTILYSKQVLAEMGGGEEEMDDRGYVEPEPLVYARFVSLADQTAQGLEAYGLISPEDKENLERLSQIAGQLLEISGKELKDELLTDDEYEFIRYYGGTIEHFWYDAIKNEGASDSITTQEYPAAVVVDIATDPNGAVLEAATDTPSDILVVIKVDGQLKIAKGTVYSFYQFAWPLDDRLTDSKWRQMVGLQPDEEGYLNYEIPVEKPEWTESYRVD